MPTARGSVSASGIASAIRVLRFCVSTEHRQERTTRRAHALPLASAFRRAGRASAIKQQQAACSPKDWVSKSI
jgi:hypothetical protein